MAQMMVCSADFILIVSSLWKTCSIRVTGAESFSANMLTYIRHSLAFRWVITANHDTDFHTIIRKAKIVWKLRAVYPHHFNFSYYGVMPRMERRPGIGKCARIKMSRVHKPKSIVRSCYERREINH